MCHMSIVALLFNKITFLLVQFEVHNSKKFHILYIFFFLHAVLVLENDMVRTKVTIN